MATGQIPQRQATPDDDEVLGERGLVAVLRLLGSGATCAILAALGDGSLRTMELAERVPGYTPRTVYRYVSKLVEIGTVEREEEPGVPSKVVHRLIDPCGVDLCRLVETYATASMTRLGNGEINLHSSSSLALLAEMWEPGLLEALNLGPCTATELAHVGHGLSFHQISRRTDLFAIGGLIVETQDGGRRRRYELTEQARRGMALIAGLGRWREKHVVSSGEPGLTALEMAHLLGTALPLVALSGHVEKCLRITVVSSDGDRIIDENLVVEAALDGAVTRQLEPTANVDGWARGKVAAWTDILMGERNSGSRIRVGGEDGLLVKVLLTALYEVLWTRPEDLPARL